MITENVRKHIQDRKFINITQLGESAGIPKDRMFRIMNGAELNADEFMNLCAALEVQPEVFRDHDNEV